MAAKGVTARARAAKSRKLKAVERDRMQEVREREDYTCRFPHVCGGAIEVAHAVHRGMGGDPTGERTDPRIMVAVCGVIHRTGRIALDKKNLRWVPLTDDGADGPIEWQVHTGYIPWLVGKHFQEWATVAVESAPRRLEPLLEVHRRLLSDISLVNNS